MVDDTEPGNEHDVRESTHSTWTRRVTLRDGSPVLLRQIRPSDRDRLAAGLKRLSPASRYLRFHTAVDELSDDQLDYLTDVDHHDHDAVVAIDLSRPDRPGVGVARFIREPYEPHVAEAAVTVADEYHGQGAGTLLLGAIAARARQEGVEMFRSYVLDGNAGMLEVFDHLGARRELETDGLWRVDLEVPADDAAVPLSAAGRAFVEVAREHRILASLIPPVWSRWRSKDRRHDGHDDAGSDDVDPAAPSGDPLHAELAELRDELDAWLRQRDER